MIARRCVREDWRDAQLANRQFTWLRATDAVVLDRTRTTFGR